MKKLLLALVGSALVCALVFPALNAAECPADLVIEPPESVEARFAPVDFSHDVHADFDCTACHHMWDGESDVQSCMSEGCHDLYNPADVSEKKDIAYYYNAFHDRQSEISCIGCHGALKKAGEPTGPITCTDCHPKE